MYTADSSVCPSGENAVGRLDEEHKCMATNSPHT